MTQADMLTILQQAGEAMKLDAICTVAGISPYYANEMLRRLIALGTVTKPQRGWYVATGIDLPRKRKPEPPPEAPRHPCGHPIAASTPGYCLKCKQAEHKRIWSRGFRYTATLAPAA